MPGANGTLGTMGIMGTSFLVCTLYFLAGGGRAKAVGTFAAVRPNLRAQINGNAISVMVGG